MGVFLAFLVGWVMGSRGGEQGYEEVVTAFKEVCDSDEFATLVGAVRTHAGFVLRQAADWLQDTDGSAPKPADLIERVRGMVRPASDEG